MSHSQNSVSFGNGFGKTAKKVSFSIKSKEDFPKTEVLENPRNDITFTVRKGGEIFWLILS